MSLNIGIRFLTGYCVAARSKTDRTPEWPPHPARVFMALAAAYFECESGDAERDALRWLESLEAPAIHLSEHANPTDATPTFVPMNDRNAMGKGGSIQTLPSLKRHRAERLFPRTHVPENQDRVYLCWRDAAEADIQRHASALRRLCGAVARLGHSSSLVQMWIAEAPPTDLVEWKPDLRGGDHRVRVVAKTSGTLDRLSVAYQTPPHRPAIKSSHGYRRAQTTDPQTANTVFDERLEVFYLQSRGSLRWLQLETTLALTSTLRGAIMARFPVQPPPQWVSGHAANGSASESPHMAIFPLAFVDKDKAHADGHLLGVAVATPGGVAESEVQQLIAALDIIADDADEPDKGTGLCFSGKDYPGLGEWRLIRQGLFDEGRINLRADTWTAAGKGARHWASVTPVVFDQHSAARSKGAYLEECAELVAESINRVVIGTRVGRDQVRITPVSPWRGVPHARDFPRLRRSNEKSERRHAHVEILFDRPVIGPLLIGAGRYRGYGLCRPMPSEEYNP